MPRKYEMSWDKKQLRWVKMYKGQRYSVACSVLGTPANQEQSYQAANSWWKEKRASIDAAVLPVPIPRTPLPLEDFAAAAYGISPEDFFSRLLAFWEKVKGVGSTAQDSAGQDAQVEARFAAEQDAKYIVENAWNLLGQTIVENNPLPQNVTALLPPARLNQIQDAAKAIRDEAATAPERTVKAQASAWLAGLEKRAAAGNMAAARVNNVRMALAHFVRWFGESADVASIDAAKLQGFYEHCLVQIADRRQDKKAGWSLPFGKEVFAIARTWIKWLTEQGAIDSPRNLASRFHFGSGAKKIPTWTVDEVKHVISEAPGKLKLALLLMANCGMTQVDVSDLADDEVDWASGTITRRRSKTKHHQNAPEVTYHLWPLTWQLLQQYRSGAEHVLLTESGLPYVRNEMVKGKLRKADGFTSNYAHLKRRLKFTKSMKLLRKTASSLLENHTVKLPSGELVNPYAGCVTLFLGHAPRSMKDKHYTKPPQELFNEAVLWLGRQFGFVEAKGRRPCRSK